jgi:hypothetical protein
VTSINTGLVVTEVRSFTYPVGLNNVTEKVRVGIGENCTFTIMESSGDGSVVLCATMGKYSIVYEEVILASDLVNWGNDDTNNFTVLVLW